MKTTYKAKNWSARFASEHGETYISTFGNVPEIVNKTAAELVKKNIPLFVATKIFKSQFREMILNEIEEK